MQRKQLTEIICSEIQEGLKGSDTNGVTVSEESSFDLDLHLDSFMMVLLITGLDERLGIRMPADCLQDLIYVKDLVEVYERELGE